MQIHLVVAAALAACSSGLRKGGSHEHARAAMPPVPQGSSISSLASEPPLLSCADSDSNCAYWAGQGYCSSSSQHYQFMQQTCCASCGFGPAPSPPPSGCTDSNGNCGYWAGQGYCSPSSEYYQFMQENCCATCGFGGGPSPSPSPSPGECVGLSTKADSATAKNIVIVASGFTSASDWAGFAGQVNTYLQQYTPLQAESIQSLNTWYVSSFLPGDNGNKCWFDAQIDRLLLCAVEEFRAYAEQTCGVGRDTSVVVVHNTQTYGGAGYMSQDVATMTRNQYAAGLAAHELGHSFFGLSDEYSFAGSGGGSNSPNCDDYSTCSKWSDLTALANQGRFGNRQVQCVQGCEGNSRWTSLPSTIMREIQNTDFGLVNERQTCCRYRNYAGNHGWPSYCDLFNSYGLDLNSHCSQYTNLGVEYIEIEKPVLWRLTKVEGYAWKCERKQVLKKGLYQAWRHLGEAADAGAATGIQVSVVGAASGMQSVKWFSDQDVAEVPGQDKDLLHVATRDRVAVQRSTIDIILSEGQSCFA